MPLREAKTEYLDPLLNLCASVMMALYYFIYWQGWKLKSSGTKELVEKVRVEMQKMLKIGSQMLNIFNVTDLENFLNNMAP